LLPLMMVVKSSANFTDKIPFEVRHHAGTVYLGISDVMKANGSL
jgi:hypothetical protein